MTKPDYREPPPPAPHKPLALQAAQFAFWAPLAAILINLLVNAVLPESNNASVTYRQTVSWLILTLNVAAFLAAIFALFGIRKHGTRGILVHAALGLLISGFVLGSTLYFAYSFKPADRIAQRLIGDWDSVPRTVNGVKTKNHISLLQDRSASVKITVNDQTVSMTGKWGIHWTANQPTTLAIKWDAGTDARFGEGVIWAIETLDDNQLTLVGSNADANTREIYQRQPK